jgi:threonine/homoserine/homoserine lactone efflux protein
MPLDIWTLYVTTVLLLMSTPGPSQLLMLSNSATHGFSRSLSTAAGDLSANALQMLAAGLGLAAILTTSATALAVVKWAGVLYLLWLGLRMVGKAGTRAAAPESAPAASLRTLWLQGFITSAANPKAVVFFAALFPQFIQGDAPFWPQFMILSLTYIVMDGLFLSVYGFGASWLAKRITGPAKAWIDRIGGGFMILAAMLLGLKSVARSTP